MHARSWARSFLAGRHMVTIRHSRAELFSSEGQPSDCLLFLAHQLRTLDCPSEPADLAPHVLHGPRMRPRTPPGDHMWSRACTTDRVLPNKNNVS